MMGIASAPPIALMVAAMIRHTQRRRIHSDARPRVVMKNLVVAWLASAAAFSIAFIGFMVLWVWLDDGTLRSWSAILRLGWVTVSAALIVQFFYGGFIYFVLTRAGLWSLGTAILAYLLPLLWIGWLTIDTKREALGMIAWVIFAFIVACVSWFFAPVQTRQRSFWT